MVDLEAMMRLAMVEVRSMGDVDEQPSPQHLRPCCPPDACQYRPGMVRAYLFVRNDARMAGDRDRESWVEYLADLLRGRAGETALLVQSNRGHGSLNSRARDIVLSLERCRDELGIGLHFGNVQRLSAALCRFSDCDR